MRNALPETRLSGRSLTAASEVIGLQRKLQQAERRRLCSHTGRDEKDEAVLEYVAG